MSDATEALVVDGRYRLDERIGGGPAGEVWRGYDLRADWTVAVTLLARASEGLAERVRAVARVVHPNVAMVLDVGEREGKPFLVSEFLTGQSLGEELASSGPLPIVEACDLIGQAAAGLDAAHRAGVVHGRVDAESLRRAGSGVLKVVGFGLEDPGLEAADDLRALGQVAYEVLTGQAPDAEPAPLRQFRAEVPEELERLVLATIAEDATARPASGEAIRRTLAAIARPKPPAAHTGQHPQIGLHPQTGPHTQPAMNTQVLPGARSGDTALYDQPIPAASSNRKLFIQLGAALAVIVLVTVVMIVWAGSRNQPAAQPTPTPILSTTVPEPTPTETPTPTESRSIDNEVPSRLVETGGPPKGTLKTTPAGGWQDFLSQLDSAVRAEERLGTINPDAARKAHEKIQKAAEKFRRGNDRDARNQLTGLGRDLTKGMEKGDVPTGGPLAGFLSDWPLSTA